jgi:hypothetical protein
MSHLEIIQKAYDEVGIIYVVKSKLDNNGEWSYLFLTNESERRRIESTDLVYLLRAKRFMEFLDGELASY